MTPASVSVVQYPLGRRIGQEVPAHGLWRTQFYLPDARFIKFNFSVPLSAVMGIYGRRNVHPTHTQYDFFHVVDGQRGALTQSTAGHRSRRMLDAPVAVSHVGQLV